MRGALPRLPTRSFLEMGFGEASKFLGSRDAARQAWRRLRSGEKPLFGEIGVGCFPGHEVSTSVVSDCMTTKLLLKLHDGQKIETVRTLILLKPHSQAKPKCSLMLHASVIQNFVID